MNKKHKIIFGAICTINFVASLLLLIFLIPKNVPILIDAKEAITHLGSKWIMIIFAIIPLILITFLFINNKKTQFFIKILIILSLFENILYFLCFSLSSKINIGDILEVPISISIFMPIAVIIIVCSIKLKTAPYLSRPAINFKSTRETEFIWQQTQIYAKDVYFLTGLILFFVSIIFCFIRFCLIEFFVFIMAIIISTIIIYFYSKSIYKKYIDMKHRQENINNKKVKEN